MKIKPFLVLITVFLPAYYLLTPPVQHIPSDLRDAVADELPGARGVDLPVVPQPDAAFGDDGSKSIYGADDRLDYYQAPADRKVLADSVVSLWSSRWVKAENGNSKLFTASLQNAMGLCPGEPFGDQPVGAFCSGTLVGEDLVMTAGHCITDEAKCADTKLVFGFAATAAGRYNTAVPSSDVYTCKKIVKRDLTEGFLTSLFHNLVNGGPGPDYAVIQLDRKVTGRKPLPINKGGKVKTGDPLFVIGHPVGLPVKVAGSANVRSTEPKYFYLADLDTFGGNSGSAVFNAKTNKIEGILVRGDRDFEPGPAGCNVTTRMPQNGGRGEAVTKIFVVEKYIP
ncbi:MAG: trypsin-like serine peptidase [Elusimicrobiales bacterium]